MSLAFMVASGGIGLTVVAGLATATVLVLAAGWALAIGLTIVACLAVATVFSLGADLEFKAGFTFSSGLTMGAGLVVVAALIFAFDGSVLLIDRSVFPGVLFASVAGLPAFAVAFFTFPPGFLEFGTFLSSPKLGVAASNAIPTATVSPRIL
ncbi:MAG TPA: hypothetical protein VGP63_08485 [Planctomycetaceae bacterium]|nr:hypothetical protein [Planctomycetaceae bacterium]